MTEKLTVAVTLEPGGVLVYTYPDGVELDLPDAEALIAKAMQLTDCPRPCLILIGKRVKLSREARDYFARHPDNRAVTAAAAMVVQSAIGRMIGNFFVGLNRSRFPQQVFDNEGKARAWLASVEPKP